MTDRRDADRDGVLTPEEVGPYFRVPAKAAAQAAEGGKEERPGLREK